MRSLLLIIIPMFAITLQAQMTITRKQTGAAINNGDVIVFNSVGNTAASLDFYVHNSGATQMRSKIEFVSALNADGTGMELCYGNSCLSDIVIGDSYPTGPPAIIPAMGRNGDFDHFLNTHVGNGALQDYVFKFYQIDLGGNEIGNSITITYRYQSVMATSDFEMLNNLGVQIQSNSIDAMLNINTKNEIKINLLDANGRSIINSNLISGENSIDTSLLNAGIYFLNVFTETGQKVTTKIVKR